MKTIYIYTPHWATFGGGEKYVLIFAEVLSQLPGVNVILLSDQQTIQRYQLEQFFRVDLSKIGYQKFHHRNEIQEIAEKADFLVCLSNVRTVRSSARKHIQLLQIPYGKIGISTMLTKFIKGRVKESLKDILRLSLLKFSREKADLVITNSQFVQNTLFHNYGIRSEVLYPPIQDFLQEGIQKRKIILSVGRFFTGLYNDKRYDILTEAFRKLYGSNLDGWEYHITGSAVEDGATRRLLQNLKDQNRNHPVQFHINESYETLRRLYNEASIFWHAAGFGVDETLYPENVEHFGMTTVEAMSAGCIPIVISKGGQREIITDGVNGFLWETVEELVTRTFEVIKDNDNNSLNRVRMNARKRFQDFSVERFKESAIKIFTKIL
ncbi:MAG: glycosyltransferase family 4 protein [Ignavibacteriae bacterium]|nr:glycosyltransferase family 4 protein [Ignavibacteriota bacterium]